MVEQRVRGTDMWPTCPVRARGKPGEGVGARRERAQEARGRARNRERGRPTFQSTLTSVAAAPPRLAASTAATTAQACMVTACVCMCGWMWVHRPRTCAACRGAHAHTRSSLPVSRREKSAGKKPNLPSLPSRGPETLSPTRDLPPRRPFRTLGTAAHGAPSAATRLMKVFVFFARQKLREPRVRAQVHLSSPSSPPPPLPLLFSLSPPQKNSGLCVWVWVGLEGGGDL